MDAQATVRAYYATLDDERYDDLRNVLAPGFTQRRPDRTFDDREAFLSFVTEDRPHQDTDHVLDGVFVRDDPETSADVRTPAAGRSVGDAGADDTGAADAWTPTAGDEAETVLARGSVETADGDVVVRFVDVFDVLADRIVALDTYTR
ncbi:hypothetical protein G9C85_10335 [Halorubellus sp. JP-L1]|uniref:hypothetical protein n=1 Tax=Halorubellus sp. JP-L1 TaxID=2715753 RepID=UPI00140E1D79|nr:hypothetical protein [Halorubellus sp. JP-L1]NHN42024.1 hypothetical protein [Halorubellus sp. JP-L1]